MSRQRDAVCICHKSIKYVERALIGEKIEKKIEKKHIDLNVTRTLPWNKCADK